MIRALDILSVLMVWTYGFVFFSIIKVFLPLRKNWFAKLAAFIVCVNVADYVIYSNDLPALFGCMAFFFGYLIVFHNGSLVEKISVLLIFYPALIAVNYLMLDIGSRIFFGMTETNSQEISKSHELLFLSTLVHTISLFLRLLFWIAAFVVLRKVLLQLTSSLSNKMWMMVDMVGGASFVAIFTIIYFMPERMMIVYPICGASIFSSFGCICLVSYICQSMQTAYRAQELSMKYGFYEEKLKEEERVRSIYHDMKNHLLVLQAGSGNDEATKKAVEGLQSRIAGYENYQHTGNDFLDIILRDKAEKAKESRIDFSAVLHMEDSDFIAPLDISTIFGNALDNAIEASLKLPEEERMIMVKAVRVHDLFSIVFENNAVLSSNMEEKTTKKDRFLHGFGIANIKRAVEKYDGECILQHKDGRFVLKLMIPAAAIS